MSMFVAFFVYCRLGQSASLKFELSSTTYQILNCCLQLNAFWIVVCNLPDFELSSATYQILNCHLQLTRFWIVVWNLPDFELSSATYQILNCSLQLIRFWIVICNSPDFELSSATYQILNYRLRLTQFWIVICNLPDFQACFSPRWGNVWPSGNPPGTSSHQCTQHSSYGCILCPWTCPRDGSQVP